MPETESSLSVVTDDRVASHILDIICKAKEEVVLVSPYLKLWGHIKDQIMMARQRGVKVLVFVRYDEPRTDEDVEWLLKQGVVVATVELLHAKIYMNESDVVVCSMNLTEVSIKNSREIALAVKGNLDQRPIREYVDTLGGLAEFVDGGDIDEKDDQEDGSCVRCGTAIDFNVSRALCDTCYSEWAGFRNREYDASSIKEVFCHECGKRRAITYARPLCRSCYAAANSSNG